MNILKKIYNQKSKPKKKEQKTKNKTHTTCKRVNKNIMKITKQNNNNK